MTRFRERPVVYTSTPSESETGDWFVWDMYEPLPPKPLFVGTMEEAGSVADVLNARQRKRENKNPAGQGGRESRCCC